MSLVPRTFSLPCPSSLVPPSPPLGPSCLGPDPRPPSCLGPDPLRASRPRPPSPLQKHVFLVQPLRDRSYMNCSPKRSKKLVVFEPKMVPLESVTVLGVLDVRNREYWSILLHRKKSGWKILFYHGEIFSEEIFCEVFFWKWKNRTFSLKSQYKILSDTKNWWFFVDIPRISPPT